MLPGNGGIPFRTTDLGFCSDSSEVIFTFSLLAPVSHCLLYTSDAADD